MLLIFLIIVVVLLLGGGAGAHYGRWGGPAYGRYRSGGLSLGAFLLIVVIVLLLTGSLRS